MNVVAKKSVTRPATTRSMALPMPPPATQPSVATSGRGMPSSRHASTQQPTAMTAAMRTKSSPLPSPMEKAAPVLYTSDRSMTWGMRVTGCPGTSAPRTHAFVSWSSTTTAAATPPRRARRAAAEPCGFLAVKPAYSAPAATTASWQRQHRPSAPSVR